MALKALIVATSVLVPTLALTQPVPKQACKNDVFAVCASPNMQKAMNARAKNLAAQADLYGPNGDANSMYGWNSAADNAGGRTSGAASGGE